MNTSGPNGGKGASNASKAPASKPVRTVGYNAEQRPGATHKHGVSVSLDGKSKVVTSAQARIKQSPWNKGAQTEQSVSHQTMGRTKPPGAATKYNRNDGQPRAQQNSMRGTGTPAG